MKWLCLSNHKVAPEPDSVDSQRKVSDQFDLLKLVGQGAFGQVHLIRHKKTKKMFALKSIEKTQCIRRHATTYVVAERQLLEQLSYPLIVNLRYAFQDDSYLYMAMDYMPGGDLRQFMRQHHPQGMPERDVRAIVADLSLSLHYLHQHNVCHRDVKPENILIDAKGHAHLSDFNIATQFHAHQPMQWSKAGSLAYMAPEMLSRQGWTSAIDWWALAIVTFELLYAKRPFEAPSNELLVKAILYQPVTFPSAIPSSHDCRQFIQGLLQKSPHDRIVEDQLNFPFGHAWFQGIQWAQLEQKASTTGLQHLLPKPAYQRLDAQPLISRLAYTSTPPMTLASSESLFQPTLLPSSLAPHFTQKKPRPSSMDDITTVTEQAQWREWLEQSFLPFDYLSIHPRRSISQWRSFIPFCF
ncbi:kinase-like protein [Hesseltinella vesiculosa]|uniref:non-specific serine/threonine protein kinase n=1 Tax=Hesseltinella vesiculosa TaxID=101127 RepID=A0A1X2GBQ3_9FUNG|nr:kinase-like protein [Hesseltinella vesiculosa]